MMTDSLLILIILAAVFVTGASFGQLVLRFRLAQLEKQNLDLEQRRLNDLKKTINARAIIIERKSQSRFEREVQDEIDQILGEIENP